MKCPYCKNEMEVPRGAYLYLSSYDNPQCKVKTDCCGKVVYLRRWVTFDAIQTNEKEDNWGRIENDNTKGRT